MARTSACHRRGSRQAGLLTAGQTGLLTATFWALYAVILPAGLTSANGRAEPALFIGMMALLAALWAVMPVARDAPAPRKLAAPAMLLVLLPIGQFAGGLHSPMILVTMVHVAFLYGMRAAIAIVSCYVVAMGAAIVVLSGGDWLAMTDQVVLLVLFAVFSLAMAAALLEAGRQREAAQRLIERIRELAVAEERARMARDMHDSIGHHLTLIKMNLENAERRPAEVWAEVGQAKELTMQALAESRRWVRALRPLALEDGQFGSRALERLARSFDGTGVEVGFQVEGPERRIDPDSELVLYRVLQEGLTNVLRHAEARRVRARLAYGADRVVLTIGDDGRGAADPAGFGLSSLAERVRGLGGNFRAGNAEEGGFELRAEVPAVRA
ncbi:sensor histidine kinase [Nonomuraea sp. NPDC050404]|uniref:sensor histidine kinase n=1 Tax=Nonomuraea sp. NPDC050404 TaxID=3155783 RepID=UPI0033F44D18